MKLYHASFRGKGKHDKFGKPLRQIKVLIMDDSIYNIKKRLAERYDFVIGLCVTNCESAGLEIFELSSEKV